MIISRNNAFSRCNLKNAILNYSKPIRVNKLVTKHLTYQRSLNICKHPSFCQFSVGTLMIFLVV